MATTSVEGQQNGQNTELQRNSRRVNLWIFGWLLISVIPIVPYAIPLWNHALADTPYAYLIWIPVFALGWGALVLRGIPRYTDDAEFNGILGMILLVISGSILFAGMTKWPQTFVANDAGLLVWPVWSMGAAWLLFGIGTTKRLLKPLTYMLLAWPPLYTLIVNYTNPVLDKIANAGVVQATHFIHWIQTTPTYGNYLVNHNGSSVLVSVAGACSGGDSFLAMIILVPVILVAFRGTGLTKFVLLLIGALLTVVMNLLRLGMLLISAHVFSANFTFGVLHPMIGAILFVVILLILGLIGKSMGMHTKESAFTGNLSVPGWGRGTAGILTAIALTGTLWPLYAWGEGTFRSPITVTTDKLTQLMPKLPGYKRTLLGTFSEASVLGPGAYGTAYTYSNNQGEYAMAELWWTYSLSKLKGYGVQDCLLFHGNDITSVHSFTMAPGIKATSYIVGLAPQKVGGNRPLYEDVSYMYAVKYHGKTAYVRAEFATPIVYNGQSSNKIADQLTKAIPTLWNTNQNHHIQQVENKYSDINTTRLVGFHTFVRKFSSITLNQPSLSPNQQNA